MTSAAVQDAIDNILNAPQKIPTKEEAKKNLQACGILNKDGKIADRYKNIIIKKDARCVSWSWD